MISDDRMEAHLRVPRLDPILAVRDPEAGAGHHRLPYDSSRVVANERPLCSLPPDDSRGTVSGLDPRIVGLADRRAINLDLNRWHTR